MLLGTTFGFFSPSYIDLFSPLSSISQDYCPIGSHLKKATGNDQTEFFTTILGYQLTGLKHSH
jgi:hypothetical protein